MNIEPQGFLTPTFYTRKEKPCIITLLPNFNYSNCFPLQQCNTNLLILSEFDEFKRDMTHLVEYCAINKPALLVLQINTNNYLFLNSVIITHFSLKNWVSQRILKLFWPNLLFWPNHTTK